MTRRRPALIALLLLLVASGFAAPTLAQDLRYGPRGNRSEGIKARKVSGFDVELLSARTDYTDSAQGMPASCKMLFYLERAADVYVTVRELESRTFYWLDQIRPVSPWKAGFANAFEWPTADVLRNLSGLQMYDLGVVARLGKTEPSPIESVAPVIFYHSVPPTTVTGYLFTFKTNGEARLTASVSREHESVILYSEVFRQQFAGRPFTIRWNSERVSAGVYNLTLNGFFLQNNGPISQTVRFIHQPNIR